MGEGGCDPEYFLHRMSYDEAVDYIRGQDRRYRQQWEMTRVLAQLIHKVETGKKLDMSLPWDDEMKEDRKPAKPEELAALNEQARQIAEMMNRKNNEK